MFPLTHAYLSTRVFKKKTPLFIFGGIVPDLTWSSKGSIPTKIHDFPMEFYLFLKKNHKNMSELGLGSVLHNDQNGADYYSHHFEGGYAMVKGKKISGEVARLLGIEEGKDSLVSAHSFIEAAIDSHVLKRHPDVLELYTVAFKSMNLSKVARCISEFLKIDNKVALSELKFFAENFKPENVKSLEGYAFEVTPAFYAKIKGIKLDKEETFRIMKKAETSTNDCLGFLDEVIGKMRKDFASFL